jgi:hypothetical protein
MAKLHDMFPATMGWTNSHRHSFTVSDQIDGMPCDDYPEEELDEKEHTVLLARRGGVRRFVHDDDFGDSGEHEVVVEDCTWSPLTLKHAVCLEGQNACPPEDVGGVGGYAQFLDAVADSRHEEDDSSLVWAGYRFDPAAFSLGAINAALPPVRCRRRSHDLGVRATCPRGEGRRRASWHHRRRGSRDLR